MQANNMNTNQGQKNMNAGSQAKPSTGGLENRKDNAEMMKGIKDIDAKLEAHAAKDTASKDSSREPGTENSKAAPKQWQDGAGRKDAAKPELVKGGKAAAKSDEASGDTSESSEEGAAKGLSLDSFKDLSFGVNKAVGLAKDYLSKEATAPYLGKLGSEVGEQVVEYVRDWAEKNNANVSVSVTGVSSQTPLYTGVGAAAGAGLGWAFGGKVGGLMGVLFGAALGTAASCVSVSFKMDEESASTPVVH